MGAFDLQLSLAYVDARYHPDLRVEYTAVYRASSREVRVPLSFEEGEALLHKIIEANQGALPAQAAESQGDYLGIPPPVEPPAPPAPAPEVRVASLSFDQQVPVQAALLKAGRQVPRRTIGQDSAGNPLPEDGEETDIPFTGGDDLESF